MNRNQKPAISRHRHDTTTRRARGAYSVKRRHQIVVRWRRAFGLESRLLYVDHPNLVCTTLRNLSAASRAWRFRGAAAASADSQDAPRAATRRTPTGDETDTCGEAVAWIADLATEEEDGLVQAAEAVNLDGRGLASRGGAELETGGGKAKR